MFTYKDNQSYFMEQGNWVLIDHFLASRSDHFRDVTKMVYMHVGWRFRV